MGKEYKINFEYHGAELDRLLRALPFFVAFDEEWKLYCYRTESNTGTMPSVAIRVEDNGVYLCDYAMSTHLLGSIIAEFISRFGTLQIEDYEL